MDVDALVKIVALAANDMDPKIREQLEDVEILICRDPAHATEEIEHAYEPAEGEAAHEPIPADCKGVFMGEPMEIEASDETEEDETIYYPDGHIFLVASNIKDQDEAALVLMHEIGHALGLDEDEVKALGLGVEPPAKEPTDVRTEPAATNG